MDDTRRLLLAFLLVLIILFLWTVLTGQRRNATSAQIGEPAPAAPAPALIVRPPVPELPERLDTLENRRLRIVFSSCGGTIRSVELKAYGVELVPESARIAGLALASGHGYQDLSDQAFTVTRAGNSLEYVGTDSSGTVRILRRYALGDDYLLNTSVTLEGQNAGYFLLFHKGARPTEKNIREDINHMNLLVANEKLARYGAKQIKTELNLNGRFRWVGMKSMYFLTAILAPGLDGVIANTLADNRIGWQAGFRGARTRDEFHLFFGPLEYGTLSQSRLSAAFDFGRFLFIDLKWIGLPILKFLQLLYGLVRNYGLTIVIFALVMKGLFFPLSRAQNRQMRAMAQLQPKIDELKRRYKNDSESLNRETMQLYKLYRINPLSGCLPLLIQMPVFFAMYQVLRSSVDLRQAQFALWITDLSLKDPYYVLPILMGVFSILQSLLTSAGQQNKLLMFMMPIFITVIFLNFPSGLQLYWLMFNILSIVESLIMQGGLKWQKKVKRPSPATP